MKEGVESRMGGREWERLMRDKIGSLKGGPGGRQHASYGPFYLEYSFLVEFMLIVKQKLPGV